jgi:hypothetical protein
MVPSEGSRTSPESMTSPGLCWSGSPSTCAVLRPKCALAASRHVLLTQSSAACFRDTEQGPRELMRRMHAKAPGLNLTARTDGSVRPNHVTQQ